MALQKWICKRMRRQKWQNTSLFWGLLPRSTVLDWTVSCSSLWEILEFINATRSLILGFSVKFSECLSWQFFILLSGARFAEFMFSWPWLCLLSAWEGLGWVFTLLNFLAWGLELARSANLFSDSYCSSLTARDDSWAVARYFSSSGFVIIESGGNGALFCLGWHVEPTAGCSWFCSCYCSCGGGGCASFGAIGADFLPMDEGETPESIRISVSIGAEMALWCL